MTLLLLAGLLASQYPNQNGFVTDAAGIIKPADIQLLSNELARYERESTNEIVVVTVPSLAGQSIEDYTSALWQRWQVGKKGKDNGVILILAPIEKKLRIQRGTGFRDVLSDQVTGQIIREDIVPRYRMNDVAGALFTGISSLERALMASQHTERRPITQIMVNSQGATQVGGNFENGAGGRLVLVSGQPMAQPAATTPPPAAHVRRTPPPREPDTDYSGVLVVLCLFALIVMVVLYLRWRSDESERVLAEKRRERAAIDEEIEKDKTRERERVYAAAKAKEAPKEEERAPSVAVPQARSPGPADLYYKKEERRSAPKKSTPYSPPPPPAAHHHHHHSSAAVSNVNVVVVETAAPVYEQPRHHRTPTPAPTPSYSAPTPSYSSPSYDSGSSYSGGSSDGGGSSSSNDSGGSSDGGGSSGDL